VSLAVPKAEIAPGPERAATMGLDVTGIDEERKPDWSKLDL
jgi:hypothetical protein